MNKEVQDLQEALEYQVNVILRLEDEQLLLQKENNLQKEKLKELNSMLQKYIGQQLFVLKNTPKQNYILNRILKFKHKRMKSFLIIHYVIPLSLQSINHPLFNNRINPILPKCQIKQNLQQNSLLKESLQKNQNFLEIIIKKIRIKTIKKKKKQSQKIQKNQIHNMKHQLKILLIQLNNYNNQKQLLILYHLQQRS
ncbi:unnamed protein product [Paramecium pentaurelia]|uniref:Uncharacterized protein n=1 Tax=Paramecium pentaurelia TaxID=43138 RepID=A0A8S1TCN0_9CILI|nr:unnamed protein product [Paramecium pentaurelia]